MAIDVNPPPQLRLPKAFRNDAEIRTFFDYQQRMLTQLWLRVGGPTDAIAELQAGELYEPGIQTSNADELIEGLEVSQEMQVVQDLLERVEELEAAGETISSLQEQIEDLESRIDAPVIMPDGMELITIAAGDTAFTTTGNQLIICNNTGALTITLNTLPDDGEQITVIRRDAAVSLVGTLNGSTPTSIPSKYDILDVYHTLAAGEWSA